MDKNIDLTSLSLTKARDMIAAGDISSVELTRAFLERIDKVEPVVKSFIHLDEEAALAAAEKADKTEAKGLLHGVPISIKDVFCTKNMATTCGSKMLEGFVPPYNATIVDKLEKEGAVIMGKVAMDEFAMGSTSENCAYQIPENPWKAGYITGGSSGGSASSVAALECLASVGTDTGGSIRQPASLCGLVGLKPTYGRVSRYGLVAFASSLDQAGPMTLDVEDSALMMNVLAGYDCKDSTSVDREVPDYTSYLQDGLQGVKIGVPKEYFAEGLEPEVEEKVRATLAILKDSGAEPVEVSLPYTEYCVAVYYIIASAEASSNLSRYDGVRFGARYEGADSLSEMYFKTRSRGFGDEVKRRILIGTYALSAGYYDAYYKKASQVRTLIKNDFVTALQKCDVLLSPVTPTTAWKVGAKKDDPLALYLSDILTISANLAGIPAMSVPCGFSTQGLPVGVQLQAAHWREDLLFKVAWNIEKAVGLKGKRADLA